MATQLLKFTAAHIGLVSAAVAILCALGLIQWMNRALSKALSTTEMTVLISRRRAKIIDLRETSEFLKEHIPKAVHIEKLSLETLIHQEQTSTPIIFIANSYPSLKMLRQLRLAGFSELYHLEGGITSWQQAYLPTIQNIVIP